MQFNFFAWIREGVKQSVLLGVSDAIEQLGTPADNDDLSPRLVQFMRQDDAASGNKIAAGGAKRKRLGRSLKEIETDDNGS